MSDCEHPRIVAWRDAEGDRAGQPSGIWSCAVCDERFYPASAIHESVRAEIEQLQSKLGALQEHADKLDEHYTLCDCCGSLSEDTTDTDAEGNNLGHVQCAQCSRIAELEDEARATALRLGAVEEKLTMTENARRAAHDTMESALASRQEAIEQLRAAESRLGAFREALERIKPPGYPKPTSGYEFIHKLAADALATDGEDQGSKRGPCIGSPDGRCQILRSQEALGEPRESVSLPAVEKQGPASAVSVCGTCGETLYSVEDSHRHIMGECASEGHMTKATCSIPNCRSRAPADDPFCADHRETPAPKWTGTKPRDDLKTCPFCDTKAVQQVRLADNTTNVHYRIGCGNPFCRVEPNTPPHAALLDAEQAWQDRPF